MFAPGKTVQANPAENLKGRASTFESWSVESILAGILRLVYFHSLTLVECTAESLGTTLCKTLANSADEESDIRSTIACLVRKRLAKGKGNPQKQCEGWQDTTTKSILLHCTFFTGGREPGSIGKRI
jgi:hypothetical protein